MTGCIAFVILLAISWAITVGIIKLICFCFGLSFSLLIATGIWLCIILFKLILQSGK